MQNAAVLGKVFWTGALAALAGREALPARGAAAQARAEGVRSARAPLGGRGRNAVRISALSCCAMSRTRRSHVPTEVKHRRAAALDRVARGRPSEDRAEMLAHHYLEALALDSRDAAGRRARFESRPAKALTEAAERALALHAPAPRPAILEAALELTPPDDPGSSEVCSSRYVKTKWALGEIELELTRGARDLALASGQRELAAEALSLLAHQLWLQRRQRSRIPAVRRAPSRYVADAPPSRTTAKCPRRQGESSLDRRAHEEGLTLLPGSPRRRRGPRCRRRDRRCPAGDRNRSGEPGRTREDSPISSAASSSARSSTTRS